MKPPASIVQPQITEAEFVSRWEISSAREQSAEMTLAQTRLEKGRLLVAVRTNYPARGPKAKGWGELLRRLRVEESTAWRYMELAGAVPEVSCTMQETPVDVPTYTEAGIVRSDRKTTILQAAVDLARFPHEWDDVQSLAEKPWAHDDIELPPSRLIAPIVSGSWVEDMESLAGQMIRAARSMFSAAEQLDALCRQRQVAISGAKFASIPTHLLAAQASIASTLRIFKGDAS